MRAASTATWTARATTWLGVIVAAATALGAVTGTSDAAKRRPRTVAYAGSVSQPSPTERATPRVAFTLSASGRRITGFRTTRSPGPTMSSDACSHRPADQPCQVSGYAVGVTTQGLPAAVFPPPVIRVAANGDFSGRISDGYFRTTYIKGHLDRAHATATGLIALSSLSTPSNPISTTVATFMATPRRPLR